ncbi:MAG: carboxypeptidase regulatory-like domain-containing protein, partial [Gemmatimonadetes bacterium]|nr:carboxypeptidase regulatory-like domain-containing protein [Gemmatimonadota bacterium]
MTIGSGNRPNLRLGAALTGLGLAAAMLLAPVTPVHAQAGVVTGTVTDRSGEPLGSAQVTVPGLGRAILSDARGQFVIRGLPAGAYTLQVQ